jgi:hypothetical protein
MFRFPIPDSLVTTVSEHEEGRSYTERFEDPRCFEARRWDKRHQGTKVDQSQERSQSRKNWIVRFPILEGPIFTDKVESK